MVTTKRIAELANVSRCTVYRALNNKPGIDPKTKEKILKIAGELNYKVNNTGKALALQKKLNFGILIPIDVAPSDNTFYTQVIKGIEEAQNVYSELGMNVEIKQFHFTTSGIEKNIRYFIEKKVMGIAILFVKPDNNKKYTEKVNNMVKEARNKNISVVTIYNDFPCINRNLFIGCDFIKMGRMGAEYLCKLIGESGKIAIISGLLNNPVHNIKCESFVNKVKEAYHDIELIGIYKNNYSNKIAYSTCLRIIDKYPDIKGFVASCGGIGGIVDALKERNLIGKVKVLVFDKTSKAIKLLKNNEIDAIIGTDMQELGFNSVKTLYDIAMDSIDHSNDIWCKIDIIIKESLQ